MGNVVHFAHSTGQLRTLSVPQEALPVFRSIDVLYYLTYVQVLLFQYCLLCCSLVLICLHNLCQIVKPYIISLLKHYVTGLLISGMYVTKQKKHAAINRLSCIPQIVMHYKSAVQIFVGVHISFYQVIPLRWTKKTSKTAKFKNTSLHIWTKTCLQS